MKPTDSPDTPVQIIRSDLRQVEDLLEQWVYQNQELLEGGSVGDLQAFRVMLERLLFGGSRSCIERSPDDS